ncbi:tryptophan synthase subunit alpha [Agrilactobacillus composti DSM 18527 = JCM 14202]|uniref:Tryptophan synthase alpha chain n=1 Tax=Agrilactobacillus composti DSM 18527 = JCM 14202 TaxID=1423734 RepID=X0QPG8_9LACO|nr:tryptophan synthase subunit alpha [Agrilactobacillus composti]KRM35070.1 tryptophan synthase subunit alpha [Agrilactobacillus composti DSM 18527 = JCM 14202]GAF40485.1 tryptophan synthase alpha chain [Agrilactobacillus composti DSM 18527 = JCM 14202]
MSNLKTVFNNHKAFIPFVVANDPDFDTTVQNVLALANNGADIVELGIPFSDPVADGPVIQDADLRAFAAGVTPDKIFDIVAEIRKQSDVPLIFLTYLNIVFKYGYDAFCKKCQTLGISGLVIPDMPYEERDELAPFADKYGIDLVPLVTPTSGHRIEKIAKAATGFIYVVSSLGITGTRDSFSQNLNELIADIRKYTAVPTAIGFGIHTPEQAYEMAEIADGAIIGSAIVDLVAKHGQDAPKYLGQYAKEIRTALDNQAQQAV